MKVRLRVLIIEDSEDDALLVMRELTRSGYEVDCEVVESAEAVRAALHGQSWDVILSDFSMPRFRGTDALKMLRERDQDTPFIFVSGTIGEDVAVEAMRSGAQDYVIKNNLTRLVPAIERELREAAVRRERRAGEARFRRVVDSAMIGILFWDIEGRVRDANDQFLKLVGYSREDLRTGAIDWRAMTPPEYEAADAEALQEVFAKGICKSYEKEFLRKDGSRVPVIVRGARLDDPDHTGVAFVLDIGDRKRVADALRASEERYRRLFERHPHPLWLLDRETLRFGEVNEAALRQYGFSREEFLGMTVEAIHAPAEGSVPADTSLLVGSGLQVARPGRHRKKDATVFDVELTSHDVDVLGRPTRLVSAVDVTERRKAEEALLARERQQAAVARLGERAIEADVGELFEAALSVVSETLRVPYCAILEAMPDGKSLLLRAGLGWREGSVGQVRVGMGASSLEGYTLQRNEPVLVEDLTREMRFEVAGMLAEIGVVSGASVVIPGKGRPFGALGAHTDAPRSFTQDDVHFLQAVAHIIGTGIDRDRAEAISRQSQRMESVGRLAGGVAHDFNNLLTAITGYSELLLAGMDAGDPMAADLEEIRGAAARAASLTRQLLAFSRRQILEAKPLDLNAIIEDMEKMLRRLISEDIELQVELQPELGTVKADPGQIEQVIVNLVVNARDAMPGGGRLTLRTANLELHESSSGRHVPLQPGRYVMLAVQDTGVGMDQETQGRIFEPFFTTKGPEQGTGLGLATVYGIVKQSGGYVRVYSEPGRGTRFEIYLPLDSEEASAFQRAQRGFVSRKGSETVLLAEDDEMVRRLAHRVLRRAGYNVLTARNGADALRLSESHPGPIHLLISDVVMPKMSGAELYHRLAARRPETRVLYLSGYTDPSLVQEGLLQGGAEFLQKPFTTDGLGRKVREVLER